MMQVVDQYRHTTYHQAMAVIAGGNERALDRSMGDFHQRADGERIKQTQIGFGISQGWRQR